MKTIRKIFDSYSYTQSEWTQYELVVFGRAQEIKRIERTMRNAWLKDKSDIWPRFLDRYEYKHPTDFYGIMITRKDGEHETFEVVGGQEVLWFFDHC